MFVWQPQNILLDMVATLLIWNKEIIAITASGPPILAIQDAILIIPGSDLNDDTNNSNIQIVAIANPRKEDTYKLPDGMSCAVVTGGWSHFPKSYEEHDVWKTFLKIQYVFYTVF